MLANNGLLADDGNASDGIYPERFEHEANVFLNIKVTSVALDVSIPLNNPDGMDVRLVQPWNVSLNLGMVVPMTGNIDPKLPEIDAILGLFCIIGEKPL